jgi:hypothetical protein
MIKILLNKKIIILLPKIFKIFLNMKIKIIVTTTFLSHSTQLSIMRLSWKLSYKTLRMMIHLYTCVIHLTHMMKKICLIHLKIKSYLPLDMEQSFFGLIFLWSRRPPLKHFILIVYFLFFWAKRPPPKSNIFYFILFIVKILEGKNYLKGREYHIIDI